ncbi:hypothetical protein ACIOJD_30325 [Streptomyces sp. NPDC088116]|uniref:hypothetical protein n=1 Tax=Streptomyces sp. NPDC088116 TaxID=3365825 RepID=UPI00382574C0
MQISEPQDISDLQRARDSGRGSATGGGPRSGLVGPEDIGGLQTFEQVRSLTRFALLNQPDTAERIQP